MHDNSGMLKFPELVREVTQKNLKKSLLNDKPFFENGDKPWTTFVHERCGLYVEAYGGKHSHGHPGFLGHGLEQI
eukprot:CAMPEP_0184517586 /NCGR_PEP_ID=MMETSP0198_2-20121128/5636_1 /TAXON_ID=1112570 /ORGANISM="Thraustochytrium sp., Strain LLF1b" /LENGTH=74 /DNA_ID=CAMNT_0026907973 /DNA_START=907 /DNA_END=1131 /DNA_ORIENTATION=+